MDEGSPPTPIKKIFGDFESRVKTTSKRMSEGQRGFGRHPSGSSLSSAYKGPAFSSQSKSMSSQIQGGFRGHLRFDESSHFESPNQGRNKRPSGVLDDPLTGLERYPKAIKSEDTRQMQAEIERLKMNLIEKDAEIVSLKADVKQEQALLAKMEVEIARDKLTREKDREALVRQSRHDQEHIHDLENRIATLTQRNDYNKEYDEMTSFTSEKISAQYQDEVERLTEELIQSKDEIFEIKTEYEQKELQMREEIEELRSKNAELEETMENFKGQQPANESELKIENEKIRGNLEAAEQEIKRLKSELELTKDDRVQHKIMKDKLDRFAKMEKNIENLRIENKLLNDTADNSQLLKEQLNDLREKLSNSEKALDASLEREETLKFAERQLKQWKSLLFRLLTSSEKAELGDDIGPDMLASRITSLQQDIIEKASEIETQKSSCVEKQRQVSLMQTEVQDLQKKMAVDKQNLTEQANLIKRFKRKLLLVTKERDSFKGILESYEHELTFSGAAFEKDRVTALESSLKDYQDTVERLEELLAAARSTQKESEIEAQMRDQISSLKNQVSRLEEEKSQWVAQAPVQTQSEEKVVHFLNNPLSQAIDSRGKELETVKAENVALKARIQLLEEGQTKDLTLLVGQKVDEGASTEEVKELKEQLKSAEIRKQRLIEAFKKTSQDFREVAYRLTGYRIDGLQNGNYRLSPVYAESPNDYLLFKKEESGECMLLETEYSRLDFVQEMIRLHLQQQNSIPVFLAAVITDMFSRQTFDTEMEAVEEEASSPVAVEEHYEPVEEEEEIGGEEEIVEEEIVEEEEEGEESIRDEEESIRDEEESEESDRNDDDDDDIVCID